MLTIDTGREGDSVVLTLNGRFSAVVAQDAERKFLEAAEASDNVIIDCA